MPGLTKYHILKNALIPYEGKVISTEQLRLLLIRNLGTSGTSIINHMRFAVDAQLIHEIEPFKFLVHENKVEAKDAQAV